MSQNFNNSANLDAYRYTGFAGRSITYLWVLQKIELLLDYNYNYHFLLHERLVHLIGTSPVVNRSPIRFLTFK